MVDPDSLPTFLVGWTTRGSPLSYLLICVLIAIGVRAINCFIKALSTGCGEHGTDLAKLSFVKRFGLALIGFHKELADHWLGTIIGFVEISFYPVLLVTDNLPIIGGWLAIKTAGSWKLWQDHPRAFNRFLICNLINLAIAYFVTVRCIQIIPSS